MGQIKVTKCDIEGLYVIEPAVHQDARGYFVETYNQRDFAEAGLNMVFVQDNQSKSTKGVLRGLHFQKEFPQGKLVRVLQGKVFDVAVDVRQNSPTYGKWFGVELSEENMKQFYISEGFAHGFLVMSDEAVFAYKVTDFYHPGDEGGIMWNDPDIAIEWPIDDIDEIILSEKDEKWKSLKWNDFDVNIIWPEVPGMKPEEYLTSEKDGLWPTLAELKKIDLFKNL